MASSTLPDQIPPQGSPFIYEDADGNKHIETDWYLFFYGLWSQVNSGGSGGSVLPAAVNISIVDLDADGADGLQVPTLLSNLALMLPDADAGASGRDLANALTVALDDLLPDPVAAAQPSAAVTVGASPFTFTASFNGHVSVTGGTVSAIALIRQGVTIATGLTTGLIPVSRLDQVLITYTVVPTAVFLPT